MEEDFQEKPTELPELHHVLGIISRRRWHFLLPFFCGWLLAWGISWFLPSTYRSGTLIRGIIDDEGDFIPDVGSTVIDFKDYKYSSRAPRIYNLPGKFVQKQPRKPK